MHYRINHARRLGDHAYPALGKRAMPTAIDSGWLDRQFTRLFNAAERDIKQAIRLAGNQPDQQPRRQHVHGAIERYLDQLWRAGTLLGDEPDEAYYVSVGEGISVNFDDLERGLLIVEVGMAVVCPAQFMVLEFTQFMH
jgi:phage tail sheath protein FI